MKLNFLMLLVCLVFCSIFASNLQGQKKLLRLDVSVYRNEEWQPIYKIEHEYNPDWEKQYWYNYSPVDGSYNPANYTFIEFDKVCTDQILRRSFFQYKDNKYNYNSTTEYLRNDDCLIDVQNQITASPGIVHYQEYGDFIDEGRFKNYKTHRLYTKNGQNQFFVSKEWWYDHVVQGEDITTIQYEVLNGDTIPLMKSEFSYFNGKLTSLLIYNYNSQASDFIKFNKWEYSYKPSFEVSKWSNYNNPTNAEILKQVDTTYLDSGMDPYLNKRYYTDVQGQLKLDSKIEYTYGNTTPSIDSPPFSGVTAGLTSQSTQSSILTVANSDQNNLKITLYDLFGRKWFTLNSSEPYIYEEITTFSGLKILTIEKEGKIVLSKLQY